MKIVKEQILKTDIRAFRGRQSFLNGLKLPLSESAELPDKEYSTISSGIRELGSHATSNLMPFLDKDMICKMKIEKSKNICASIYKGRVFLYLEDTLTKTRTQKLSVSLAKEILNSESYVLYKLQQNAAAIARDPTKEILSQKEQQSVLEELEEEEEKW